MPFSSRGVKYFGNVSALLSCTTDHEQIANNLYLELSKSDESYGSTECPNCGAYITVSIRGIEWETKVFSRPPQKER